jgi:hypothetical protein
MKGAVLGSPISHSLSPVLHKAAFEFLGLEGTYSAIEVTSGTLQEFVQTRGSEFDYLSLTMPLKEEVLALDVEVDELTRRVQSGNTLINRDNTWSLTSTDGSGLVAALAHAGLGNSNLFSFLAQVELHGQLPAPLIPSLRIFTCLGARACDKKLSNRQSSRQSSNITDGTSMLNSAITTWL